MKLTKAIVASLSLPAIVVPMTTLTSCSQGWGNATPFAVGSLDASPYRIFEGYPYYDIDGIDMVSYLQSSYAVQPSGGFYAYSSPMKFDDKGKEEKGEWVLGDTGWYTSADSAFVSSVKDVYEEESKSKSEIMTNARNAALAANINFVATIGNTINSYLDLALQYQASQLNKKDNILLKDVATAWGAGEKSDLGITFDHGSNAEGTSESDRYQNNNFIEYCLALSNLVGTGIVNALFKTSQINFKFSYDDFPLPSYSNVDIEKKQHYISDGFYNLIENASVTCPTGKYWQDRSSKPLEEKVKVGDEETIYKYKRYTYENVPVIVHFNGITKTYVNPRIKNKFLVNDVYSTNEQILKGIGSQWDKIFPEFADAELHDGTKPLYQSFDLNNEDNTGIKVSLPGTVTKYDERINWSNLYGSDFVVLVNYAVDAYDEDGTDITADEAAPERNKAIISGVSNFFPSYFFALFDDMFKPIKKDSDVYVIDTKAVNRHNGALLGLLDRSTKDGQKAHASDVSKEGQRLLSFLAYMFGDSSTKIVNTDDVLNPINQIR